MKPFTIFVKGFLIKLAQHNHNRNEKTYSHFNSHNYYELM